LFLQTDYRGETFLGAFGHYGKFLFLASVPGSLDKSAEEVATFCLIKDGTFFTLFCLTNSAHHSHINNSDFWPLKLIFRIGIFKNNKKVTNHHPFILEFSSSSKSTFNISKI
jgi:hypothetical protein